MTDASATPTEDHELLTTKQKERNGNTETATVRSVHVNQTRVTLSLAFDWTTDSARLGYDLEDRRDVQYLESVAAEHGFEFAQLPHLEGLPLSVRYEGDSWIPSAHPVPADESTSEIFGTKSVRTSTHRLLAWTRSLSVKQVIIGVILVKKVLLIAILVVLVL